MLYGDILGSLRCDCGDQLSDSIKLIERRKGIILYMNQEGRGIGISNKLKAISYRKKELTHRC